MSNAYKMSRTKLMEGFFMNETLSILKSRRSIKNFQPEQIKDIELEAILEAGAYAPSASNIRFQV